MSTSKVLINWKAKGLEILQTVASYQQPIIEVQTTERGILRLPKALIPNKASGQDGISLRSLKQMVEVIAAPLTRIFQASIQRGEVPHELKIPLCMRSLRKKTIRYQ